MQISRLTFLEFSSVVCVEVTSAFFIENFDVSFIQNEHRSTSFCRHFAELRKRKSDKSRNTHTSWVEIRQKSQHTAGYARARNAAPFNLPSPPPAAAVGERQVRGSESEGRMERGGQDDGDGDERAGRNGRGKIGAEGRYRGSGKNEKKTMGNVEPSWGAGLRAPFQGQSRKRKEGN